MEIIFAAVFGALMMHFVDRFIIFKQDDKD